jgi:hypothetical protein
VKESIIVVKNKPQNSVSIKQRNVGNDVISFRYLYKTSNVRETREFVSSTKKIIAPLALKSHVKGIDIMYLIK